MSDEGTRRSRISWIASIFHPHRMVSAPTLAALQAVLTGRKPSTAAHANSVGPDALSVPLSDLPDLNEVGGIARIALGDGEAVGVARVGRTSFVGYRLEADVLKEIEIILDEGEAQLRIVGVEA